MFQAYDVTSCDMSCDCDVTKKKKKFKRNQEKQIKRKRKMLVSKHFITSSKIVEGRHFGCVMLPYPYFPTSSGIDYICPFRLRYPCQLLELKIVDSIYFLFLFSLLFFIFISFYFLDLGLGFSMTSYVTVTNCYKHPMLHITYHYYTITQNIKHCKRF